MLKKYYKRILKYGQAKGSRRILLKVTEVYRRYKDTDADISIKQQVNEAAEVFSSLHYIFVDFLPYSDGIEKIYLSEDRIEQIEHYMEERYQVPARCCVLAELHDLMEKYAGRGFLTNFYCDKLKYSAEHSLVDVDIERERDLLDILVFIQNNEQELYAREVSMLVYGRSKYFEDKISNVACNIIREALKEPEDENGQNDEILQRFHIFNVEQDICIKGDFVIKTDEYCLETKYFAGGVSLSSKDIQRIHMITVRTENILTVENRTSYYRFERGDCSEIYLGGYAARHQVEFLKKLYQDNPACHFLHFGDIDTGGFLIHQHLCGATGIDFGLFHMGVEELNDVRYRQALQKLTERDIARAGNLAGKEPYKEIIGEMLRRGVKLEQEIVSYYLMNQRSNT